MFTGDLTPQPPHRLILLATIYFASAEGKRVGGWLGQHVTEQKRKIERENGGGHQTVESFANELDSSALFVEIGAVGGVSTGHSLDPSSCQRGVHGTVT